jgi:hypothetical protein
MIYGIFGIIIVTIILLMFFIKREFLTTNSPQLLSSENDYRSTPSMSDTMGLPYRYF